LFRFVISTQLSLNIVLSSSIGIDLYYPGSLQKMLDSAEGRLHVLERDIGILMHETQLNHPQAPAFQALQLNPLLLPDTPSPPLPESEVLAEIPYAEQDDVRVAQLNEQLLIIMQMTQAQLQKLTWIRQVYLTPSGRLQAWQFQNPPEESHFSMHSNQHHALNEWANLRSRVFSIQNTTHYFLQRFYTPSPKTTTP
jgi:hypothetical protein